MLWEGEGLMVSPSLEQYQTMEVYDPKLRQWEMLGEFVEKRAVMNAVVVNDVVYIIGGQASGKGFTDSTYSAKLPLVPPTNLYLKDGNASVEAELSTLGMADGSVTLGQLAPDALAKIGLDHNPATSEEVTCLQSPWYPATPGLCPLQTPIETVWSG